MKNYAKTGFLMTRVGAMEFHRSVKVIKEFFSIILAVSHSLNPLIVITSLFNWLLLNYRNVSDSTRCGCC